MGFFDWLNPQARADRFALPDLGIASPYGSNESLSRVVASDIFGPSVAEFPLTRSEVIGIPAVSRARNLLISAIADVPLEAHDVNGRLAVQPSFLYRSDSPVSIYDRLCWTLDDFVFYGYSLWTVTRGAAGQILTADYCPMNRWTITDGKVLVNEQEVPESSYIFFNAPFEGLLNIAQRTLRGARDIESAWQSKARNPAPYTLIRSTNTNAPELPQEEIDSLIADWAKARRDPDGALGYLPADFDLVVLGQTDPGLLEGGRNASRTDIANFLNMPVSLLDGSTEASLTYSTTAGNRSRFYDETLPFWHRTITTRLSQDDVVPRGQSVHFNFSDKYALAPLPTGLPEQD